MRLHRAWPNGQVGVATEPLLRRFHAIRNGTAEVVASFGRGRAEDCRDPWYASSSQKHGLASPADLDPMRDAWMEWAESPEAYAAFAWRRDGSQRANAASGSPPAERISIPSNSLTGGVP